MVDILVIRIAKRVNIDNEYLPDRYSALLEDSYLAKMNYARKNHNFKPYTGRDYEQFKKNYGFGTGHLGFDAENITSKEKVRRWIETFETTAHPSLQADNLAKTREYAQQVDARNRKKGAESVHRTASEPRQPTKVTRPQRVMDAYDT